MQVHDTFLFKDGTTVFTGPVDTELKFIGPCDCEILSDGEIKTGIRIDGEMLPSPSKQRHGHRAISTRDTVDLSSIGRKGFTVRSKN